MEEIERIVDVVKQKGCKIVGLQYPEGMRMKAAEIANEIEERSSVEVMLSANPSYGACDVPKMPVDLIMHLGHAPMPHLHMKDVEFFPVHMPLPSLDFLDAAMGHLGKRVGLITTVQHAPWLDEIARHLEKRGFEVHLGGPDGRIAFRGQVLGCDYNAAKSINDGVDCFLYIGTGDFHPLGVAIETGKPVIVADPFTGEIRDMASLKDRILRQRHGAIARARDAKSFGIIVSKKVGQNRMALARRMKKRVEENGLKALILLMDNVDPDLLKGYDIDAYVCTACPRIAIDDYMRYEKPILTPQEMEIVLGIRTWEEYRFDEIVP